MPPVNGHPFAGRRSPRGVGCRAGVAGDKLARDRGGGGTPKMRGRDDTLGVAHLKFQDSTSENFSASAKVCSGCSQAKPRDLNHFPSDGRRSDGLRAQCRRCFSAARLARYAEKRGADYRPTGPRQPKAKLNNYRAEEPSEVRAAQKRAERSNPVAMLKRRLRERARRAIGPDAKNSYSLGCSAPHLRAHIERQFLKGMSWDNRAEWHVDHIRPLASFDLTDPEQVKAATHFTNLRPMWAADNLRKGASMEVLL